MIRKFDQLPFLKLSHSLCLNEVFVGKFRSIKIGILDTKDVMKLYSKFIHSQV
jgi:hypothetical protein